jgi:hypothetical protein
MLRNPLCSAAALLAMVVLPSSVSASLIGAGTRAAAPSDVGLLQEVGCRRIRRFQDRVCDRFPDGRMICRPAACRVICHRR